MKNLLISTYLLAVVVGCSTSAETDTKAVASTSKRAAPAKPVHSFETVSEELSLETNITETQLRDFDLYGRFFDKRIQFFTLDNPNFGFGRSAINFVSLCFIDSVLMRKRYSLQSDISSQLIRQHGKFTFRPTDSLSREALAAKKVASRSGGLFFDNKRLENYQLKWQNEHSTIIYKSFKRDTTMKYEFLEEVTAFKPLFREIERSF